MKLDNRVSRIEKGLSRNTPLTVEDLLRVAHLRAKKDLTDEERSLLKELESRPLEPKLEETLERLRTHR